MFQDPVYCDGSEAWNSKKKMFGCPVYVNGEVFGVAVRPVLLRVGGEGESTIFFEWNFITFEAVFTQEEVDLVEAVFTSEDVLRILNLFLFGREGRIAKAFLVGTEVYPVEF